MLPNSIGDCGWASSSSLPWVAKWTDPGQIETWDIACDDSVRGCSAGETDLKDHNSTVPWALEAQRLKEVLEGPWALEAERLKELLEGLWAVEAERLKVVFVGLMAAWVAAFDAMLAATVFAALVAAMPFAAIFWDNNRGLALALAGLGPVVVGSWGTGGLCKGPSCSQPYLGTLAATMAAGLAAWMDAATRAATRASLSLMALLAMASAQPETETSGEVFLGPGAEAGG